MEMRLNPRLETITPSAIRVMHDRKRATSLDLGMGQPSLLPDPEPFERATQWVRTNGCPYSPPAGVPELRERISAIYGGRYCARAENVLVSNGSQEGLYLAIKTIAAAQSGEVLVTEPSYPSYERVCALEGVAARTVSLPASDDFAIHADALLEAITPQTRLIVLGLPANPTGAVMRRTEMERLASGLAERSGPPIYLVVDEVYRELTFTPEPYTSFMDLYPHTIAVHSLSKSCALTGLRMGFLLAPSAIVEAATRAHSLMMMSVNMFAQRVALDIVSRPGALRAQHDWYARQRQLLVECAAHNSLSIIAPQGAFYALALLPPAGAASEAAAEQLLARHDVVTIPGCVFGPSSDRYLRLTWAAPADTLKAGIARVAEFLAAG
ncbi:MAG: pyridoxal phosphate-dependent aminotransferase [Candidatus Eremiobacteraeota bacterium]|nr:pyridoxal phosphate-dependent aminotransferase [Candidatus Eremiobacteraeota bacterium]